MPHDIKDDSILLYEVEWSSDGETKITSSFFRTIPSVELPGNKRL
jgi:hypothetical protein